MKQETFTASFIQVSYVDTERGPDIVHMPYIGQKRTISGLCTISISEGLDIPMVVMLFICYVVICLW